MDVRSFLLLDTEGQFRWIENLIMGQNPRLRIGQRMNGPVGVFKNGEHYTPSYDLRLDEFDNSPGTVSAKQFLLDDQKLDGHPWLDIDVGSNNFLHLYEVTPINPFGPYTAGQDLPVTYGKVKLTLPLTEDLIIAHTEIIIRVAFSK